MNVNELNCSYGEYKFRFRAEFDFLLTHSTFAKVYFANDDVLQGDQMGFATLSALLGASLEGLALSLNRIWDANQDTKNLFYSIPNLADHFSTYRFLGCRTLHEGNSGRKLYHELTADPLRSRLRVLRSEALAHSLALGRSRDRASSDLAGSNEFKLINGEVVKYAERTTNLLYLILDDFYDHTWRNGGSIREMRTLKFNEHVEFLKQFSPDVSFVEGRE